MIIKMSFNLVPEALDIKEAVEKSFEKMRKTPKYKDYPATVCSATSQDVWPETFTSTSKQMRKNIVTDQLRDAFINKLGGDVGDISPITASKNPIGQCSEQHSANNLLRSHPIELLDNVKFSICLRPRTLEYIPTCINCFTIFKNLDNGTNPQILSSFT